MSTDIKLEDHDGTWVTVQGNVFKIEGADLMLESVPRRKSGTPRFRRALVHDFEDGLTVNWADDYPGGVTINGNVNIPKQVVVSKLILREITTTMATHTGPSGVSVPRPTLTTREFDLMEELRSLRARISELEGKLKK